MLAIEKQLSVLAECGISLSDGISVEDDLLAEWSREHFESEPYSALLCTLGSSTAEEQPRLFTNNVWHFDTECIYDGSDYVRLVKRVAALAGDDLPIVSIEAEVNAEEGYSRVAFSIDGEDVNWELGWNGDWVDGAIFVRMAKLLNSRNSDKTIGHWWPGDQTGVLICTSPGNIAKLAAETGLNVENLASVSED